MTASASVCAVVLTYNRQGLLLDCLRALQRQTRPLDTILVVDNAGTDGTPERLRREFPEVQVLALAHNVGAAGGFVEGMRHAYAQGFDWLWVMDDDAYARPDALAQLLVHADEAEVLVPWQSDRQGQPHGAFEWRDRPLNLAASAVTAPRAVDLFAFIGALISRRAIAALGLPYADYFIDFFDWEYSLRLSQAGMPALLVPESVIDHDIGQKVPRRRFGRERLRYYQPAWKNYYDTRNYLLTLRRRSLGLRSYLWYAYIQPREALRDLLNEPDGWRRVQLRARGVLDGSLAHSGERPGLMAPSTQKAARLLTG